MAWTLMWQNFHTNHRNGPQHPQEACSTHHWRIPERSTIFLDSQCLFFDVDDVVAVVGGTDDDDDLMLSLLEMKSLLEMQSWLRL